MQKAFMQLLAILVVAALSVSARAQSYGGASPSYVCSGRLSQVEQMICSDQSLAALDREMDQAYRGAVARGDPSIKQFQNAWIKDRDRCRTPACVGNMYRGRLAELGRSSLPPQPYDAPSLAQPLPSPITPPVQLGSSLPQQRGTSSTQNTPPVANLPDRTIWEGQMQCGSGRYATTTASLVLFNEPANPRPAFVLFKIYTEVGGNSRTVYAAYQYNAAIDEVLDQLILTNQVPFDNLAGRVDMPRQLNMAFDDRQSTVRARISDSCELVLQRKLYPVATLEAWKRVKADSAAVLPITMIRARNQDEFCSALAGWTKQVKDGSEGRDLNRLMWADNAQRKFWNSVFHESLTLRYIGLDIRRMDEAGEYDLALSPRRTLNYVQTLQTLYENVNGCRVHPFYVDDEKLFYSVFYKFLVTMHYVQKLKDPEVNKLPNIQDQVARIASMGDRFTSDGAGLARMEQYTASFQSELSGILPQVRDAVLRPVLQRQAAIMAAILQPDLASTDRRSVEQLVALRDAANRIRTSGAHSSENDAKAARAETIVARDLTALIAADRPSEVPPTSEGLARLAAWHKSLSEAYAPFATMAPVIAALKDVTEREAAMPVAILRANIDAPGRKTLEDLQVLRASASRIRADTMQIPDSKVTLDRADRLVEDRLNELIAHDQLAIEDTPATTEGIARLVEWRMNLSQTYAAFATSNSVQTALTKASEREMRLSVAMLQAEAKSEKNLSVQQLAVLRASADRVRVNSALVPDATAAVDAANATISRNLASLIAADQAAIQDLPGTAEGLARLNAWRSNVSRAYAVFATNDVVKAALADATARQRSMLNRMAPEMRGTVATAPDAAAIRAIRLAYETALRDVSGDGSGEQVARAYLLGLEDWMNARSAAPQATPSSRPRDFMGGIKLPGTPTLPSQDVSPIKKACLDALSQGDAERRCTCMTPQLQVRLTNTQQTFFQHSPANNWPIISELVPGVSAISDQCAR